MRKLIAKIGRENTKDRAKFMIKLYLFCSFLVIDI